MNKRLLQIASFLFIYAVFNVSTISSVKAATFEVSPPSGTYEVGDTFTVKIFADTDGESINAIDARLSFPPDKIQLSSPASGKSVIKMWTTQPFYDNRTGSLVFQGTIPGGINVDKTLVTELTFRVKAVGQGVLRFTDKSQILLNDGKGTDVLRNSSNGVYKFVLPPPQGPEVTSKTHLDQSVWYNQDDVQLSWQPPAPEPSGYSYVLNDEPVFTPDDIAEGDKTSVFYKDLSDGTYYFHIKAERSGVWGGVSHFAINIDTEPPAQFPIEISPSSRTSSLKPIAQFVTTDSSSGIDYYELSLIPLSKDTDHVLAQPPEENSFFIETTSPYIMQNLERGSYNLVVRAYDQAGNFQEKTERLEVVSSLFTFVSDRGLVIRDFAVIPWLWFWTMVVVFLVILLFLARHVRRWNTYLHKSKLFDKLPSPLKDDFKKLKQYSNKYTKILVSIIIPVSLLIPFSVYGQENPQVVESPPTITTYSENITDDDLFYIVGETNVPETEVIIYRRNVESGETFSNTVTSNKAGEWFYRQNNPLSSGEYVLWTQARENEKLSPPSPQITIRVEDRVLSFGFTRISHEALYLSLLLITTAVIAGLIIYIIFHGIKAGRRQRQLRKEIQEAEEAVRKGFVLLRRDIETELSYLSDSSAESKRRAKQLREDLAQVESRIGKEVKDIEDFE